MLVDDTIVILELAVVATKLAIVTELAVVDLVDDMIIILELAVVTELVVYAAMQVVLQIDHR